MRNSPQHGGDPLANVHEHSQQQIFNNYQMLLPREDVHCIDATGEDRGYDNLKQQSYYYPYFQHHHHKKPQQLLEQQQQNHHHHHHQQQQQQQQKQSEHSFLEREGLHTQTGPGLHSNTWQQRLPENHHDQDQRQQNLAQQYFQNNGHGLKSMLTPQSQGGDIRVYDETARNDNDDGVSEDQYVFIDEDEHTDFEEEERLREIFNLHKASLNQHSATSSLLRFSENVTLELQKCFSRTKDQEDACDIYEDKWATTKSGRELYYADLIRIAQGDTEPRSKSARKGLRVAPSSATSSSSPSSDSASPKETHPNDTQFTGIREVSCGLGPLEDLFEFGLKKCKPLYSNNNSNSGLFLAFQTKQKSNNDINGERNLSQNLQGESSNRGDFHTPYYSGVPMQERSLPESFWKEPKTLSSNMNQDSSIIYKVDSSQRGAYLNSQKLPDFTDLMESWQGEEEDACSESNQRENRSDPESSTAGFTTLHTLN